MSEIKQKLINLSAQRTRALDDAEAAYNAGNRAEYDSQMAKVDNLNADITNAKKLLAERDKQILTQNPTAAEAKDMAEERGAELMKGHEVKITVDEVRRSIYNTTNGITLATAGLTQPVGTGSEIHDLIGARCSSIVDMVHTEDLTGMSGYQEPYVVSELEANGGAPKDLAGTARAASKDPVFAYAVINPYECNLTTSVDRNIQRLTNANYYGKIQSMAMDAMRRKLANLIVNGDGTPSPIMYGIKTAKNKDGTEIFAGIDLTTVDENLLDDFFYAYGSDDTIGGNARLLLNKADLKAIGKIRNSLKEKVFTVRPEAGNPNNGTIEDSGVVIPYTIVPSLTALSGAKAQSGKATPTMLYGDPANYELGFFGDLTIRIDESCEAKERMLTILGDAMVGGNLIRHHGFVLGNLPKNGG